MQKYMDIYVPYSTASNREKLGKKKKHEMPISNGLTKLYIMVTLYNLF